MAKQFQNGAGGFDSDLDAILNRVYGISGNSDLKTDPLGVPSNFGQRGYDSKELKDALTQLRDRREKAQSSLRMKEEISFLQEQIRQLKQLGDEIESLRDKLDAEPAQD